MISANKFRKLAEGCGLQDFEIYSLYKLLRKTVILHALNPKGSVEDRKKIGEKIEKFFFIIQESSGAQLKNKLLAPLKFQEARDIIDAHERKFSSYERERLILNHRAEIYKKFLEWDKSGEPGKNYVSAVAARLDRRRKKVVGQRAWRFGLLGGVTLALGTGIYLYSKGKKDDDKK